MTNGERFRRHFSNTTQGPICNGDLEDIGHVLRTCPRAIGSGWGVFLRGVIRDHDSRWILRFAQIPAAVVEMVQADRCLSGMHVDNPMPLRDVEYSLPIMG
ncbi:hypothetical protein V6N12_068476 [Hibiscus sabdariffa]|uniref:Reverse transcriptase n=1 Tax=Hibiscus sabdariffa TaxID=183260 RepID=A0ABR2FQ22_9ROSI